MQDLSNLVKKLANETTKPPPPRADTARPPVKSPRYSDFANNPENDLSNKPAVAAPDAPSIPGLPASVARQMPWLAAAKAQPAQDAESDLEGLIPKARSSPSMARPDDRTVVPRTEVIAMRSRLNKKLSESNTYNRFLQREVQYREQALSDSKALMIALAAEMRELSEVAEEIVKTDGLPVTRKINGRYLPSHLSNRLEELYSDLRQQLEGIEKLRLREVPLVWFGMAEDVKVMGSFDGWTYGEQMSPETTGTMTRFTTVLKLRPGRYEIKFLVDGEWRVATEWPTVGHDTVAEEKADDGMPKATTPTSTSSPTSGRESIRPVVSVATTTNLRANPVLPDRASLKAKYKQRMLNFARPAGPTLPAPSETVPPTTRQSADDDSEEEDKGKTKGRRPLSVEAVQLKCKEQWLRYFPWLFISETKDGRPCMRCSVCMVFGDPHYKYGRYGEGGLDIQKQTMRKHHFSVKHEAAVLQKEQRDGLKKGQKSMTTFDKGDDDARRIARLMAIALFICKSDAPIVLFVALVQFMAEQGTPDMPLKENGTYYSEEALAAKDAATAFPDLQIVDKAVRSVVDILGRLVVHTRFKELQEVICETHLEMQGIKDVRWLSRGNAIQRLVAVFPAVVIVLQEFDKKMYATVTSFKFHFLLYLLADVLKELNLLNLKFQQRQTVHNTTLLLRTRYLDSNDETFGQSGAALGPFLAKHASGKCREVKVDGLDSTGVPTTHRYLLHEEAIVGQQSKGDLSSCLKLGRDFVVELIKQLDYRLHDLASLNGAKLFKKSQYPKSQAKRERRLAQWLQSLRDMYKKHPEDPDTLPGVLGVLS
ncbi:unnamed protein product [Closterium sp. Naga37s-1]|nr:unnamed protein product [Closterium sp. Naga37s-1]